MPVIWELDFYSRPVLDEQQKKRWEVLICESPLDVTTPVDALFRYAEFCSNTEVNSVWLRTALEEAIAQASKPPDKIRFFRRQMNNMIIKACQDAGIPVYASRRTLALHQWLEQRMQDFYPTLPNYQPGSNPSVAVPASSPKPLPDALIGQQWAFVTLEVEAFTDMSDWSIDFGEAFSLSLVNLAPKTPVPGIIIYSPRALPLAAWMSGLELAYLAVSEEEPKRLLLQTGANDAWILASLPTAQLQREAQAFAAAKQHAQQVHFLAVQTDPQSQAFTGFWLMQELNLV
jgi:hypothetical protein